MVVKSLKVKLQTAQNKIIRFIINQEPRYHLSYSDFRKVNYLDVDSRVDFITLNLMYNIAYQTAPVYMSDYIPRKAKLQCTRNSDLSFMLPHVKTPGSHSFKFNGIKLWNSLPNYIKCAESKDIFKLKCKQYLFDQMYQQENQEFLAY